MNRAIQRRDQDKEAMEDNDTQNQAVSAEQLKEQLTAAISDPKLDSLRIAELANALADLQTDFVRFTVDASHVERLGYELVGKQGTALGELVKNAYDADATIVTVEILNDDGNGHSVIRVEDDGEGMDVQDIKQAWMRISTSRKVNEPRSTRFKRQRAGKKGIGRFAVQRLGKSLTLTTGQSGSNIGWKVIFDWDSKHQRGRDITLIPHEIESYSKDIEAHGTKLQIHELRDKWDSDSIQSAWRSVILLQAPIRDYKPLDNENGGVTEDPGFQAFIDLKATDGRIVATRDLETEFSKSALAQISGHIDENGVAHFEVHSSSLNLHETHTHEGKDYKVLGKARLESDYFIYASGLFSGLKVNAAQQIAKEIGGVRLYRNGFRVAPYGDPDDDWLKLAVDSARRFILVPANNFNFMGRVYITSADNPALDETSSREGLIENESYRLLVDFVRECLYWAVKRIGWARDRKTKASEPRKRLQGNISERVATLLAALKISKSSAEIESASNEIVSTVSAFEDEVRRAQEDSIRYEAMLRVLASLGLSISVFAHEVRAASSFADDSTQLFLKRAKDLDLLLAESELRPLIEQIESGVDKITVLGDYLGGLTAYAGTRKLATQSMVGVIQEFDERLKAYLSSQGVMLSTQLDPSPLRTCPVHRSELDSVLFNLVTNSLKAIKRKKPDAGQICLSAKQDKRYIVLTVSDNGSGISDEIQEKIFDAFFTTTGADEDDAIGSGAGLGLKIVADIAANYGGSVRVVDPPADMTTSIEFRLLAFDPSSHTL